MSTKIKSGTCSSIYRISDKNAVKVVHFSKNIFLNLLEIILYFTHCPYLVNAFEYKLTPTYYAINMPRAACDLSHFLDRGPPKIPIKNLLLQMSLGLHFLHSLNIIHGDIKPSNFLVFKSGSRSSKIEIRLSDFGLCKISSAERIYDINVYTSGYKPPELFKSKSYSFKSDVWALGQTFKIFKGMTLENGVFLEHLIQKMTQENEELRWNLSQVINYLDSNSAGLTLREDLNSLKNLNSQNTLTSTFIYKNCDLNSEEILKFESNFEYFLKCFKL